MFFPLNALLREKFIKNNMLMNSMIKDIKVYHIYDSRGTGTIECDIVTDKCTIVSMAPSGASTGKTERKVLPAKGIGEAITKFKKEIAPKMIKWEIGNQRSFDEFLHEVDGTNDFSGIGTALSTSLSIAYAKYSAYVQEIPLYKYIADLAGTTIKMPYLMGNVMNGGKHAIGGPDIQEYLSLSMGKNIRESIEANFTVHKHIAEILKKKGMKAIGKGDEGGWVVSLGNVEALEILHTACSEVREEYGYNVYPALDFAASQIYSNGLYKYKEQSLDLEGQIGFVSNIVDKYGLLSVEDPIDEGDFEGFAKLTNKIGNKALVIGDDLYTTDTKRLEKGIALGSTNAVLVKVNQIGTLTDTVEFVKQSVRYKYKNVVSHRSGETCDPSIAHISVGLGSYALKTGVMGGERVSKLNELIKIEEDMG